MGKSKPFQQTQGQRPSVNDLAELRSVGQVAVVMAITKPQAKVGGLIGPCSLHCN
jgi:hypothetical protein